MIHVHPNGDLTTDRKVSLTMYRETTANRYEPAFDEPCGCRLFIGQYRPNRPPVAFHWRCRVRDETTSISVCRECPVPESEKSDFIAKAAAKTYIRKDGPPTEDDRKRFAEFLARFGITGAEV